MLRTFYTLSLAIFGILFSFQASAQDCESGDMTINGIVSVCTATDSFDLNVENSMFPTGGGFGYLFSDALGGSGGLAGGFSLSGAQPMATYDADLNGVLSFNGLSVLTGQWVIKSIVYADSDDVTATICSVSADSLIVNFTNFSASGTNNGDGTATANANGGTMPYDFLWEDGQTTQTAVDLPLGMIGVTITDAAGCVGEITINITDMLEPCTEWLSPSSTVAYNDFNTIFGGAPCDDGTGCPFLEMEFEVYAGEAYTAENFVAGGTYAFSICNGPGAGSWVPEFTIIAPSGAVDAFGAGDGDGCTITWTASEDGAYIIIVNEVGFCGGIGSTNTSTDNGMPALTCVSGEEVMCGPIDESCTAGTLTHTGEIGVCDDGTFDIGVTGDTINDGGGLGYYFDDILGGTGGIAGGVFVINAESMVTYDNDLGGLLSANNLPQFEGTWVIKASTYSDVNDATATICDTSVDSLIVTFSASPTLIVEDNGDGSATANATGGITPYTYAWDDGQTTQTATNLSLGNIGVTVTDANGCIVEGAVNVMVAIDNIEQLLHLTIAPNPATDNFAVLFELNTSETVNLQLVDITGRNIKTVAREQTTGDHINFDMSNQAAGIYMLRIQIGSETLVRKVMIGQ